LVQIKDVAQFAGVSPATVSRVLSDKGLVRESTRTRVLAAIRELGYKPSRVARSLRVRSSQIIGLIISDIENPFFTSLVRAVEDVAYEHGYAIFLCNSDEDREKESLYIDLMIAEQVAGVILTATQETGSSCCKLVQTGTPTVSVDRRVLDCELDTVVLDNIQGAFNLTEHLIQMGHTRIGVITGLTSMTTGRERYEGYCEALSAYQIPYEPELVKFGQPTVETGHQHTQALLSLDNPPSALFTGNNMFTVGALHAIREAGLQIPDDISIVAFDDPEWTTLIDPMLTVVAQPTYELGQKAAQLILQRIANTTHPCETIVLPPRMMYRNSVKAYHRKGEPQQTT
jgi:DNA-binding LacI/PurR family transcriptional regulator